MSERNLLIEENERLPNDDIFELKIVSKTSARDLAKKICFFSNCERIGQRWVCECCELSFCTNHSRPSNHLFSTVKCSMCINDEDKSPALFSYNQKQMCFSCINKSYLIYKKSSLITIKHLEFVDCAALKKCANNLEHFFGLFLTRFMNTEISEMNRLLLKCRYLVAIFYYHCEELKENTTVLDLMHLLMSCGKILLCENEDMDAINSCLKTLKTNDLYDNITRRRKRPRILISSQL